jgi:hypothetical protein
MSRIIKTIEIEGKPAVALFDTGAYHTYIHKRYVADIPHRLVPIPEPYTVALGGRIIKIKEICIVIGRIEGLSFDAESVPVDEVGYADGYKVDAIIGTLTMEKWEIKLDPRR